MHQKPTKRNEDRPENLYADWLAEQRMIASLSVDKRTRKLIALPKCRDAFSLTRNKHPLVHSDSLTPFAEREKLHSHVWIAMLLMVFENLAIHDIFEVVGMRFEPANTYVLVRNGVATMKTVRSREQAFNGLKALNSEQTNKTRSHEKSRRIYPLWS
jgi:hypothetical protein